VSCSGSRVIEHAVGEWRQRPSLAFVLEKDILSTCCNKDDVMWRVWPFWEIIIVTRVCCYSVNHFWANACATQYEFIVVNDQTTSSKFHKVVYRQYWWPKLKSFMSSCFMTLLAKYCQNRPMFRRVIKKSGTVFWDAVYMYITTVLILMTQIYTTHHFYIKVVLYSVYRLKQRQLHQKVKVSVVLIPKTGAK